MSTLKIALGVDIGGTRVVVVIRLSSNRQIIPVVWRATIRK